MTWWVHQLAQDGAYVELVAWIFWVLAAITLHELAHGWAAIWQGDDTPIRQQRMTISPFVHMGWMSLLALAVFGIAWGAMPVDPSRFRWGRRGRVVVAAAGPAMNVGLALAASLALVAWLAAGPAGTAIHGHVSMFLWTGAWLNVLLALFNLLPVPPLDGSQILSGLSFRAYRLYQHPNAAYAGLVLVVLVFMGLADSAILGIQLATIRATDALSSVAGGPPLTTVLLESMAGRGSGT